MIAPASDSWLMVFDPVEDPSAAISDADGLLAELGRTSGALALDIIVADGDDLVFLLTKASEQGGIVRLRMPNSCNKEHEPTLCRRYWLITIYPEVSSDPHHDRP
jgi:hypothetical protein